MDDSSSLGKVSGSTESVATVTSEEFVLVQPTGGGSPSGSEGKPRLKVRVGDGHATVEVELGNMAIISYPNMFHICDS